jgi:hypothetical protein
VRQAFGTNGNPVKPEKTRKDSGEATTNRDWGDPSFLPWASGAIRNGARFAARTAARRKRREHAYAVEHERSAHSLPRFPDTFIATLPRSRRAVALLINLGMGRREIAYLLGLSDMAMRQRIAGVRKAFADFAGEAESDPHRVIPGKWVGEACAESFAAEVRRTALRGSRSRRIANFLFSQRSRFRRRRQQTGRTAKGAPENAD